MKRGLINICFIFFGIIVIFVLTFTYILYFQVGNITKNIKEELYYAIMNSRLELDKEELSYSKFSVDKLKLEDRLNIWKENVKDELIQVERIDIEELLTNIVIDKAITKVKLKVTFIPLVKVRCKLSFYVEDEISIKLLKYS